MYKDTPSKPKKYGPGYSHILTSLKEREQDEYEAVFPKVGSNERYASAKNIKRQIHKLSSGRNYVAESTNTSKTKLAPLVGSSDMTQKLAQS